MPLTTDTTRPESVIAATRETARSLFPRAGDQFLVRLFARADDLFSGRYLDYQANDLLYHDFRHTLQVTMAYVDLFSARQASGRPPLTDRHFELGLAMALFHDSGYIKLRSDRAGTGAKYTFCHVLRSCALAASCLPALGLGIDEIETVIGGIRCTDAGNLAHHRSFASDQDRELGFMVATADYLGQMAAADYPEKLKLLFTEIAESDDFLGIPEARRLFKSSRQLLAGSAAFWEKVTKPKLDNEFGGVYRFLYQADGTHPYLDAIEHNLSLISARTAHSAH